MKTGTNERNRQKKELMFALYRIFTWLAVRGELDDLTLAILSVLVDAAMQMKAPDADARFGYIAGQIKELADLMDTVLG